MKILDRAIQICLLTTVVIGLSPLPVKAAGSGSSSKIARYEQKCRKALTSTSDSTSENSPESSNTLTARSVPEYRRTYFPLWYSWKDINNIAESVQVLEGPTSPFVLGDGEFTTSATLPIHGTVLKGRLRNELAFQNLRVFWSFSSRRKATDEQEICMFIRLDNREPELATFTLEKISEPDRDWQGFEVSFPDKIKAEKLKLTFVTPEAAAIYWKLRDVSPISVLHRSTPQRTAEAAVDAFEHDLSPSDRQQLLYLTHPLRFEIADVVWNRISESCSPDEPGLIPLLDYLAPDKGLRRLIELFDRFDPGEKSYTVTRQTLERYNPKPPLHMRDLVKNAEDYDGPKYRDFLRILGRMKNPGLLQTQYSRYGDGTPRTRALRILTTAKAGSDSATTLVSQLLRRHNTASKPWLIDALKTLERVGANHYRKTEKLIEIPQEFSKLFERESNSVRLHLLEAARYLEYPGVVRDLLQHTTKQLPVPLRRRALRALGSHQPSPASKLAVRRALRSKTPAIVEGGAAAASDRAHTDAMKGYLIDLLRSHPSFAFSREIVASLVSVGERPTLTRLTELLVEKPHSRVALYVAEALWDQRKVVTVPDYRQLVSNSSLNRALRINIIRLLGLTTESEHFEFLSDIASGVLDAPTPSQERDLRKAGIIALGHRRNEAAIPLLRKLLESKNREIAQAGIRAFGFYGTNTAIQVLQDAIDVIPSSLKSQAQRTLELMKSRIQVRGVIEKLRAPLEAR